MALIFYYFSYYSSLFVLLFAFLCFLLLSLSLLLSMCFPKSFLSIVFTTGESCASILNNLGKLASVQWQQCQGCMALLDLKHPKDRPVHEVQRRRRPKQDPFFSLFLSLFVIIFIIF
jgi:hypothetical protein